MVMTLVYGPEIVVFAAAVEDKVAVEEPGAVPVPDVNGAELVLLP